MLINNRNKHINKGKQARKSSNRRETFPIQWYHMTSWYYNSEGIIKNYIFDVFSVLATMLQWRVCYTAKLTSYNCLNQKVSFFEMLPIVSFVYSAFPNTILYVQIKSNCSPLWNIQLQIIIDCANLMFYKNGYNIIILYVQHYDMRLNSWVL